MNKKEKQETYIDKLEALKIAIEEAENNDKDYHRRQSVKHAINSTSTSIPVFV